ncbi:MAG: DUF2169 domain-containing protein [Pirellulaceae bacterium]|nr:DUF2169 domain-containing protein [Pirellulaceae bacterium]
MVVCKASFSVARGVHLLDKQLPIQPVDSFNGPPEASSIKDFSDLVPEKPNVDVVLQGSAVPRRQGETEVEVRCRFGHHWEKTIQVFGKRQWKSNGFFLAPSSPEPIQKIPLQYEFAFGGADLSNPDRPAGFAMNPVGRGFAGRYSTKNFTDEPVPNLVLLGESMQAPTNHAKVAGFGWIAGHWQPRMTYAGTYDDNWLKNDMPIYLEILTPATLMPPQRISKSKVI